ncbi:MAG: MYXO-CTERM sorting domain-containing protein [Deltaproteobacteria bacterium]|nr:MYXO-CTERM sorting domain-containing protein [Deltaproteobacteria bacterium]
MNKPTRAAVVVTTALLVGTLAAATGPDPLRPHAPLKTKPAKGHENTPFVDDELMVSDPINPRVLHSKRPGVIDRKWIERTATPRIPKAVLDEMEAVMPAPVGDRVLQSPEAPPFAGAAFNPFIDGNVLVVDGNGLTGNTQNGLGFDHNNAAFNIINLVLQNLGDDYDFVSVFTTFDDAQVAAYYFPIKQDTDGLGKCDFQNGDSFGCLFDQTNGQLEHLQGFVFMNSLNTWRDSDINYDGFAHSFTDFESSVFSTLGQEVAHRWGSALRFVDADERVSELLLGRDNSHWAAYVDTDASVMDGWDWADDDGKGRFELLGDMEGFSTLDLYTMGAVPVAAAKPFFVIDDAVFEVNGQDRIGIDGARIPADIVLQLPSVPLMEEIGMDVGASGNRIAVTMQDVANAEGNRCPDPDATQKSFRQAVVLVTRPDQTPAQVANQIADLNLVLETWEAYWLDRTKKTLRLCTSLDPDFECSHAEMELVAGDVSQSGDSLQPGGSGTISLTVSASGRDVENARIKLVALGESAEFIELQDSVDVGTIKAGEEKTVDVDVAFDAAYPCGFSALVKATVSADNAADIVEEVRMFPGLKTLSEETFADDSHKYGVNVDEKDGTTSGKEGALRFTENVELTCDMTQRSVERDASPGDRGAFVTGPGTDHVPNLLDDDAGEGGELDGDTSLWSPKLSLKGTRDPEFRFAYWFDGAAGDSLKVQLSGDNEKTFITGKEVTESFHGWVVGRVSVRDVFDSVPETVTIRFLFDGGGTLEGGVDDVRLLDYDGQCLSVARGGFCGCSADGDATPVAPVAVLLGLAALCRSQTGRRRRSNRSIIDGDSSPVL